jgi:hypothetical protein
MLAWRLWLALNSPLVRHPVFKRTIRLPESESHFTHNLSSSLSVFMWLLLCPLACTVPLVAWCTFLALPGAKLAAKVGAKIGKDHAQGMSTLLGVTPNGNMGVSWVICTAYRDGRPPDFSLTLDEIVALMFFCCLSTLAFGLAGFSLFMIAGIVLLISYVDFAQSLVMGGLVGILAAHSDSRVDARLQAVAGYIILQLMVYLPVIGLGFTLLGLTLGNSTPDTVLKIVIVITALGCLLFAVRESLIVIVWHRILATLNADLSDLADTTYDAILR